MRITVSVEISDILRIPVTQAGFLVASIVVGQTSPQGVLACYNLPVGLLVPCIRPSSCVLGTGWREGEVSIVYQSEVLISK
jgi:hypothetical protein